MRPLFVLCCCAPRVWRLEPFTEFSRKNDDFQQTCKVLHSRRQLSPLSVCVRAAVRSRADRGDTFPFKGVLSLVVPFQRVLPFFVGSVQFLFMFLAPGLFSACTAPEKAVGFFFQARGQHAGGRPSRTLSQATDPETRNKIAFNSIRKIRKGVYSRCFFLFFVGPRRTMVARRRRCGASARGAVEARTVESNQQRRTSGPASRIRDQQYIARSHDGVSPDAAAPVPAIHARQGK